MKQIFAMTSALAASGYFNTHAGMKLFVCETPQEDDLTEAEFAALTWVQVSGVGSVGETGSNTNILTYETWDDEVVQKGKGLTDAGSPDIEGNDAPPGANSTPTIRYNRGLVTGPREPNGRNEDFDLEIFGTGLQQKQIKVAPVAGA